MGKSYEITKEELKEIQRRKNLTKDKNEYKRFYAIELRAKGLKVREIAEKLDVLRVTVSKWIATFKKDGADALMNKKIIGNRRNLSIEEEKKLLSYFEEKANKGQLITVKEIEQEYIKLVGHSIGTGQIYRVLKRHNWRKVMPRSKHPKKASEEVMETSKKLTKW